MFTASRSHKLSRMMLTSFRSACFRRRITHSAVEGAREPSLDNRTLPEYFSAEILSRRHDHPALICRQEHPRAHGGPLSKNMGAERHLAWDFNEFDSHIRALARGLVGLGVNKGDRVGVIMGNTRYLFLVVHLLQVYAHLSPSAYAMLQWACASIGAILVTINPAYRTQELVGGLGVSTRLGVLTFPRRLRLSALSASVIFFSCLKSALLRI